MGCRRLPVFWPTLEGALPDQVTETKEADRRTLPPFATGRRSRALRGSPMALSFSSNQRVLLFSSPPFFPAHFQIPLPLFSTLFSPLENSSLVSSLLRFNFYFRKWTRNSSITKWLASFTCRIGTNRGLRFIFTSSIFGFITFLINESLVMIAVFPFLLVLAAFLSFCGIEIGE